MRLFKTAVAVSLTCVVLSGCVANGRQQSSLVSPIQLDVTVQSNEAVVATYRLAKPTNALHYAQYLGGYRSEDWQPEDGSFRWIDVTPVFSVAHDKKTHIRIALQLFGVSETRIFPDLTVAAESFKKGLKINRELNR